MPNTFSALMKYFRKPPIPPNTICPLERIIHVRIHPVANHEIIKFFIVEVRKASVATHSTFSVYHPEQM